MTKKIISERMKDFDSSAIRAALSTTENTKDLIDLSIGFPEDNTPESVKFEAIRAIENNHTRYTTSNGMKELRTAISVKLRGQNGLSHARDEVSVVPGLTTGILLVYLAILDSDDEIIIPDPFFPPYKELATMLGAKPRLVDTAPNFQLKASLIEKKISPKTKIIVINSPNNPTGAIYEENELKKIAKLAKKHGIIVISDEIYEHFTYKKQHFSIGSVYKNTLTLNGFSKAYGMTGWRLGYIAGPAEIIEAINELQQYIVFSSNSISQVAGMAALKCNPKSIIEKYKRKREYLIKELSPFFDMKGGDGAFYFFLEVPAGYKHDMEFVNKAAKKGLIILPGQTFSKHKSYFRVSFGGTMEDIKRGTEILKSLVPVKVKAGK